MLYRATDYEAANRGEADVEHYYCSMVCAEAAGFKDEDCEELFTEDVEPVEIYSCEECGEEVEVEDK